MIHLIDTSAWIDFFRGADTRATFRVRELIGKHRTETWLCGPITMELLAGVTRAADVKKTQAVIDSLETLEFDPRRDFDDAGLIQRAARTHGKTIRSMVDCQIAAVALRHQASVVHKDADFAVIAELTGLRHEDLR